MKWILIFIYTSTYGATATTQEFDGFNSCMWAKKAIEEAVPDSRQVMCVPKYEKN